MNIFPGALPIWYYSYIFFISLIYIGTHPPFVAVCFKHSKRLPNVFQTFQICRNLGCHACLDWERCRLECERWTRLWKGTFLETKIYLGGGFQRFLCSQLLGEMIQIWLMWKNGSTVQPPSRYWVDPIPCNSGKSRLVGILAKKCKNSGGEWWLLGRGTSQLSENHISKRHLWPILSDQNWRNWSPQKLASQKPYKIGWKKSTCCFWI